MYVCMQVMRRREIYFTQVALCSPELLQEGSELSCGGSRDAAARQTHGQRLLREGIQQTARHLHQRFLRGGGGGGGGRERERERVAETIKRSMGGRMAYSCEGYSVLTS